MAQPKKYISEVTSFTNPVSDIYSVTFRSLSGRFRYLPGQFLHLALDEYDPGTGWPESRCFSLQSSPSEELIKITFAVKGRYTSRMASELHEGMKVNIKLPYGDLFQKEHSKHNVIFIAGGTGITPFLSLITDPSFCEYVRPKLYLGVREKRFNLYEKEIDLGKKSNSTFETNIIYQDIDGMIDINSIYTENHETDYFISGPQEMISVFKSKLIELGIKESNIKTDDWE